MSRTEYKLKRWEWTYIFILSSKLECVATVMKAVSHICLGMYVTSPDNSLRAMGEECHPSVMLRS